MPNYYNYSQGKSYRLTGYLTDTNNVPIQGGVVQGQDKWWIHTGHTITKEDGSFDLLGSFPFSHWGATTTMYSVISGEISPDTARIYNDSIPTINLGKIRIHKLKLED